MAAGRTGLRMPRLSVQAVSAQMGYWWLQSTVRPDRGDVTVNPYAPAARAPVKRSAPTPRLPAQRRRPWQVSHVA